MPRSNLVNAVDVALAADVAGADPTIQVTDPALLPAVPFYLVIDPFNDAGREYLRATSLAVDVLSVERDLDGSQSTTHTAGDIVRISYVAQHLSDLWAGIEGIPPQTYLHADLTDVTADQHHTRYTDAEAVAAVGTPWTSYLPLAGGTLTGRLTAEQGITIWGGSGDGLTISAALLPDGTSDNHLVWNGVTGVVEKRNIAYLPLTGGTLTGRLLLPDGSEGSPSLAFSGWDNAGFYLPSAAQIGITANGERIALFTNNNTVFASRISITQRGSERPSIRIGDGTQPAEFYHHGMRRTLSSTDGRIVHYRQDGGTMAWEEYHDGGIFVGRYASDPDSAGDTYAFQVRNLQVTDATAAPDPGLGKDGDVILQYVW